MAEYTSVTPIPYEELLESAPNYQMSQGHPSAAHADQRNGGPEGATSAEHLDDGDDEELEAEEVAQSKVDYLQVPISHDTTTVY